MLLELFINFQSLITENQIAYKYIFAKFIRYIDIKRKICQLFFCIFIYLYNKFNFTNLDSLYATVWHN